MPLESLPREGIIHPFKIIIMTNIQMMKKITPPKRVLIIILKAIDLGNGTEEAALLKVPPLL